MIRNILSTVVNGVHKWLNEPNVTHVEFPSNAERMARFRKVACYLEWQISQAEPDSSYKCTAEGDQCSFSPELIASAKRTVKEQEETNPEWDTWVAEWKLGKKPWGTP